MWNKIFYKILIGILTLLAYLPLNILYMFSDFIFFIVYYIVGYRRGTVKHNLNLIFGKSNPEAIPRIEKAYYHHMCDCIVETVKLLHISDEECSASRIFLTAFCWGIHSRPNRDRILSMI